MNIRWSNIFAVIALGLVIAILIHGLGRLGEAFISLVESVSEFGEDKPIYALAVLMALAITLLGLIRLLINAPRK